MKEKDVKEFSTNELVEELIRRGARFGTYGLYQDYEIRKKYTYKSGDSDIGDYGEVLILPLSSE